MAFFYYPVYLIAFYYKEVILGAIKISVDVNIYLASLLSIKLLLRTFFKPLKNEYREGLVGFSRIFGVFIKSVLLFVSISILLVVLAIEFAIIVAMLFIPFSFIFIF